MKKNKLIKEVFFDSLKWHHGKPPFFEEPTNSQVGFYGTVYDKKVVAIEDNDGDRYLVGQFNSNLCMGMCNDCLNQEGYDGDGEKVSGIRCFDYKDVNAWAEFYEEGETDE